MKTDLIHARAFLKDLKSLKPYLRDDKFSSLVFDVEYDNLRHILNIYEKLLDFISFAIDNCNYFGEDG